MSDERVRQLLREIDRELQGTGKTLADYLPPASYLPPGSGVNVEFRERGRTRITLTPDALAKLLGGNNFLGEVVYIGELVKPQIRTTAQAFAVSAELARDGEIVVDGEHVIPGDLHAPLGNPTFSLRIPVTPEALRVRDEVNLSVTERMDALDAIPGDGYGLGANDYDEGG